VVVLLQAMWDVLLEGLLKMLSNMLLAFLPLVPAPEVLALPHVLVPPEEHPLLADPVVVGAGSPSFLLAPERPARYHVHG